MDASIKDRLIVALDVKTAREALDLFARLRPFVGMFKVGSKLFTSAGPSVVREIVGAGGRVFLDLKFHDIPAVVSAAAVEAARLGVSVFTVHASGGSDMMRRTSDALSEVAEREGLARPQAIGVTVLTSMDDRTLNEVGVASSTAEQVRRLARLASDSGLDGAVASPREAALVRETVSRPEFIIVTPGVHPSGAAYDDQRRVMTPAEAFRAGADYLVMGRAIISAPSPEEAAQKVIEDITEEEESMESGV